MTTREKVLAYIIESIDERGYPPTIREIAVAVGLASTSGVHDHLAILEQEGFIERGEAAQSRALRVLKRPTDITPLPPAGLTASDERIPVVASFIDEVLALLADDALSLKERAGWYAMLRPLRLKIDRALRPMTDAITDAMVDVGARQWGPLKIAMRSRDVKYVCNDLGNWEDAGVQSQLGFWRQSGAYRPYIRDVPRHLEVDTIALRDAMQQSDPGAFELYQLLNDKGYRTSDGKKATLTVEGG